MYVHGSRTHSYAESKSVALFWKSYKLTSSSEVNHMWPVPNSGIPVFTRLPPKNNVARLLGIGVSEPRTQVGSRDSLSVERRAPDRKVSSSNLSWSGGRFFSLKS